LLTVADKLAALRAGVDRIRGVRCPLALVATMGGLALAGCGGSSHAAGTVATNAAVAPAQGASTTPGATATGGTTTGGATPTGKSTTTTPAGATTTHTAGSGAATPSGGSKATPTGAGSPRGGAGGQGSVHAHSKPSHRTGSGVKSGANAGTGAGRGSSAPSAYTGIPYEVHTSSMEPAYMPETMVYYDPTRTHPQVGDVVVFYLPSGAAEGSCGEVMVGGAPCREPAPGLTKTLAIKRVVGLPGDTIAVRGGQVVRNGQTQTETFMTPCGKQEKVGCEFPKAITVPAGHYYLMSDNRGLYKEDSRIFGAVPQEAIVGTVEGR
jgi:signal peptidase I